MDTVTEAALAIAMAQAAAWAVIHRNLKARGAGRTRAPVKSSNRAWWINPLTIGPRPRLADALKLMERHHISGIPVVEGNGNRRSSSAFEPIATCALPPIRGSRCAN